MINKEHLQTNHLLKENLPSYEQFTWTLTSCTDMMFEASKPVYMFSWCIFLNLGIIRLFGILMSRYLL